MCIALYCVSGLLFSIVFLGDGSFTVRSLYGHCAVTVCTRVMVTRMCHACCLPCGSNTMCLSVCRLLLHRCCVQAGLLLWVGLAEGLCSRPHGAPTRLSAAAAASPRQDPTRMGRQRPGSITSAVGIAGRSKAGCPAPGILGHIPISEAAQVGHRRGVGGLIQHAQIRGGQEAVGGTFTARGRAPLTVAEEHPCDPCGVLAGVPHIFGSRLQRDPRSCGVVGIGDFPVQRCAVGIATPLWLSQPLVMQS